jgi:hypothetical protein
MKNIPGTQGIHEKKLSERRKETVKVWGNDI